MTTNQGMTVRSGKMSTIYGVQRDPSLTNKNIIRSKEVKFPFISGTAYKGDWSNNCKDGFGIQSELNGDKYEGEWSRDKKHGKGTLWTKKGKKYVKQYEGEWEDDYMYGYGIYYYPNGEIYKGCWIDSKRNGTGKMQYSNKDLYDGEWKDDKCHGQGTLYLVNGNIYDGHWIANMKEGPGKFLYAATRKVYAGEWVQDQPQCGEYRQPNEVRNKYPLSLSFSLSLIHLHTYKYYFSIFISYAISHIQIVVTHIFFFPSLLICLQAG